MSISANVTNLLRMTSELYYSVLDVIKKTYPAGDFYLLKF
jgi:hypothetical protein